MKRFINRKYVPWILLVLVFIFTILLNYYVQWRCLDSDMASEMVLANLLNEEGSLISRNWYYSTEVRVFCEQMWFQLGLFISPNNWRIARLIGHSINLAILIISFIFLLYSTSIKEKGIWIAIVLLLPFDFWYLFFITYGGFYICHTVALFVMLGLLLRYINNNKKSYLLLLFMFGVIFGLNGIKVLMYFTVPCVLTLIVISVYKYISNNKRIDYYKSLVIGTLASLLSTGLGVGIYLFVICNICTCTPSFSTVWGNINITNVLTVISNYLQSLGFINNDYFDTYISILSINGILGAFGLLNAIVFIMCFILLLRNTYFKTCKDQLLFIFIVCAFITGTIIFSLTQVVYNGSYWLPFIPFSLIVIELFLDSIKEQGLNIKYFRIAILISFILCSLANNDWYLTYSPRSYKGMKETTEWLQEKGCKKVIAEFWAGNAITEYSNGEIEVYSIYEYGDYYINPFLQVKAHDETPLEPDVYVVIPLNDYESRDLSYLENNAEKVREDKDLIVYRIN